MTHDIGLVVGGGRHVMIRLPSIYLVLTFFGSDLIGRQVQSEPIRDPQN